MKTLYNSTRDDSNMYTASQCILKGISDDGGLFVTSDIDRMHFDAEEFIGQSYNAIAKVILSAFFSDFSDEQIDYCIERAYNEKNFETTDIFSMKTIDHFSYLELYRGRTIAFKDAALSILPYLMKCAKDNLGEKSDIIILTATSGDTGKAALEGFRDADGIDVIVFYPHKGVSDLQLMQMMTQEGNNVFSVAVKGNFDDAQTAVKEIFNDEDFNRILNKEGKILSSANSINIGRLIPQIVYYYYAYSKLRERGIIQSDALVNFAVPTGNFGNILAGYYAYKTGLPVGRLICCSNDNNVLFDFFEHKVYDRKRDFKKTISPSMDILISSNLERLIYEFSDRNSVEVTEYMRKLNVDGEYELKSDHPNFKMFYGGYATEDEIREAIKDSCDNYGYLIDTHTATGFKVYKDYIRDTSDETHTVILSTASPFKFSKDVYASIYNDKQENEIKYMYELSKKSGVPIPEAVDGIESRPAKKEIIIDKAQMRDAIMNIVKRVDQSV